jgi:hypothetical protein
VLIISPRFAVSVFDADVARAAVADNPLGLFVLLFVLLARLGRRLLSSHVYVMPLAHVVLEVHT